LCTRRKHKRDDCGGVGVWITKDAKEAQLALSWKGAKGELPVWGGGRR
jgi:hypothetical protein